MQQQQMTKLIEVVQDLGIRMEAARQRLVSLRAVDGSEVLVSPAAVQLARASDPCCACGEADGHTVLLIAGQALHVKGETWWIVQQQLRLQDPR